MFDASLIDGPEEVTVRLRVRSKSGNSGTSTATVSVLPTPPPLSVNEDIHNERRAEHDALPAGIPESERRRHSSHREVLDLAQRKQDSTPESEDLDSNLKFVHQWRNANFVLLNPTHVAVAVQDDGKTLRVLSEAEGELAEAALGEMRNWHVPRIRDAPLTREVFQRAEPGQVIPADLTARIRQHYWKPQRFVPFAPEIPTSDLELVVFRDLETYSLRMGYFLAADAEGIDFFPLGTSRQRVPYSRIQPGSARRGPPEQLLRTFSNVDFLEYCLLRVAQRVGSVEANGKLQSNVRPMVLVHVEIDIPDDHLRFHEKLDEQLEVQGRPPEYIEVQGALGILAFLVDLGVRTSVPARRKALREEMLKTDPHRRARHFSRYVEDEVMARLSWLGISPVSDKDFALFESSALGDIINATVQHDATHVLLVTVKAPRRTGEYHLSLRLYREDGKDVWADEGDRVLEMASFDYQHHMVCGRPAVLYLKKEAFDEFLGQESPPVISSRNTRSSTKRYSRVVYLENAPDSAVVQYRPLFQKELRRTPQEHFESVRLIETLADVPQEHILPYVVCRIAEAVLPAAGRVVQSDGRSGIVAIGRRHGVKPGDRLRVLRIRTKSTSLRETSREVGSSYGLLANGESVLPTELTVTETADGQSMVTVSETRLDKYWPENVSLKTGDLALVKAMGSPVVTVETPVLRPTRPKIFFGLKLHRRPLVRQKFEADARHTAVQVAELLRSALLRLQVPVVLQQTKANARAMENSSNRVVTHRVYGTITLSPTMNLAARSSARPVYRLEFKVSPVGSKEVLEQFDFDLKDFVLRSAGEGQR